MAYHLCFVSDNIFWILGIAQLLNEALWHVLVLHDEELREPLCLIALAIDKAPRRLKSSFENSSSKLWPQML